MPHNKKTPHLLTLHQIAQWSGADCCLPALVRRQTITGVNNDSRTIGTTEVFVALSTEKDDGHRYVADALRRGATAALVAKKKLHLAADADPKKLMVVSDPLKALQRIASNYRGMLDIPLIGITGSSGKTTARSFIAAVLKQKLTVGETSGNLNNHIGVPISLLRFNGTEDIGLIEMGANHEKEIHLLSKIAKPTIGIVTNVGYAHIGYFGSLAAIARAKLEIVDGMSGKSDFLLLNGDDPVLISAARGIRNNAVYFGFSRRCNVRARNARVADGTGTLFEVDGEEYRLAIPGRYFIYSALLAIHLGVHFGVQRRRIAGALESLRPVALRGTIEKKSGITFIVDCYNANPSSMKAAIGLLRDVAGKNRPMAIVGDMLELGRFSPRLHGQLGRQLADAGVHGILAVGAFASIVADGAIAAGMKASNVRTARDSAEALTLVNQILRPGDVVLLKGSRGVHLETVFEGFKS